MISTTDPDSMTSEERRLEVASILAGGLLRRVRMAETADVSPEIVSKESETGLDVPAETRLSVAPRPAGKRVESRTTLTKGAARMTDIATEMAALDRMTTGDLAERYTELHRQACWTASSRRSKKCRRLPSVRSVNLKAS